MSAERNNSLWTLTKEIENTLRIWHPDCQVLPYGSVTSGFAFEDCDLDAFVCSHYYDHMDNREIVCVLADILRSQARFTCVTAITEARIPIVQLQDQLTGISVDLNPSSFMGVKNSELLRFWKNYDRRCDLLVKIVKHFAFVHQITGRGMGHHLNSYALVLMVIFFLQTKDILPSVASLQEDVPEDICESWNCAFNRERKTSTNNTQSITELLMEFFQFYIDFDFSTMGVCPYNGQVEEKTEARALVVKDPFELTRNVTGNVDSSHLGHTISCFKFAVSVLSLTVTGSSAGVHSLFQITETTQHSQHRGKQLSQHSCHQYIQHSGQQLSQHSEEQFGPQSGNQLGHHSGHQYSQQSGQQLVHFSGQNFQIMGANQYPGQHQAQYQGQHSYQQPALPPEVHQHPYTGNHLLLSALGVQQVAGNPQPGGQSYRYR